MGADPTISLGKRLCEAQEARQDLLRPEAKSCSVARLEWLEMQLAHVVLQLQARLVDLSSGLSLADIGFTDEEFDDMLVDLDIEIANLRSLIRIAKAVGR